MNLQAAMMYGMGMLILMLSAYGYTEHMAKERCQLKAKVATEIAKEQKALYDKAVSGYEYGIKQIAKRYESEIVEIDSFKRNDDEDECQASFRMLNGFKY